MTEAAQQDDEKPACVAASDEPVTMLPEKEGEPEACAGEHQPGEEPTPDEPAEGAVDIAKRVAAAISGALLTVTEGVLPESANCTTVVGSVEVPVVENTEDKPTVVLSSDASASEGPAMEASVDEAGAEREEEGGAPVDSVEPTPDSVVEDESSPAPCAVVDDTSVAVVGETDAVDATPMVGATASATVEVSCRLIYLNLVVRKWHGGLCGYK